MFRQLPADPQGLLKRRLSLREFPLGLEHVADPAVRDRQPPLPARVGGVLFRQLPADPQGLPKRLLSLREFPLGLAG